MPKLPNVSSSTTQTTLANPHDPYGWLRLVIRGYHISSPANRKKFKTPISMIANRSRHDDNKDNNKQKLHTS